MTPIILNVNVAPGRTQRYTFSESPITFGREADNTVVLTAPQASRKHGSIEWIDDQWVLINQSANGTVVNRKRVTKKPQPLRDGDRVLIGDEEIFTVMLTPPPAAEEAEPAHEDESSTAERREKAREARSVKKWVFIGGYVMIMLVIMVILRTCDRSEETTSDRPTTLTASQIEDEIRTPLPKETPDASQYAFHLSLAREKFGQLSRSPDKLYRAYDSFQQALSYSPETRFPPGPDQIMYDDVTTKLVSRVTEEYERASRLLDVEQYTKAMEAAKRMLEETYLANEGPLYESLSEIRIYAAERARGGRLR